MALAESDIAAFEPESGLRHNCGVAAFYFNTPGALSNLIPALTALNHRGQEGVGVVGILDNGTLVAHRGEGLVRDNIKKIVKIDTDVRMALGHDRYSTSGGHDAWQPFGELHERIVTAHNGNITNPLALLNEISREDAKVLTSDTHVIHKAINAKPKKSVEARLKSILPKVEGSFSLTIADIKNASLYLIRDPWGFRPLYYAALKDGNGYMAASETVAFTQFVDDPTTIIEVLPGQCLRINAKGVNKVLIDFPKKKPARCVFELVYLGGAASSIFGAQVHRFRRECGSDLAKTDIKNGFTPNIIIPIRDSGAAAAEGYSRTMIEYLTRKGYSPKEVSARIPREGLLRSNYVQRTFILPKGRSDAITEKFTVIPDVVQGKSIVLIDDSIVRGNTMTHLVQMLRAAGALEVHVRSASPPVRHGCYYGVDFTGENGELIARDKTEHDVMKLIGANSIKYLPLDHMVDIASRLTGKKKGFCTACFDGKYPVPVDPKLLLGKPC